MYMYDNQLIKNNSWVSYLYKYIFCLFVDNLYALSIIVVMKCMSFRFSAKRFNFEKH